MEILKISGIFQSTAILKLKTEQILILDGSKQDEGLGFGKSNIIGNVIMIIK